jgi:NAD(P)-dependent dehydrogenase (short-subunit alcohol dehydrogenase family)
MQKERKGKVVCVTGGSRSIGFATARAFAAEEAQVGKCSAIRNCQESCCEILS